MTSIKNTFSSTMDTQVGNLKQDRMTQSEDYFRIPPDLIRPFLKRNFLKRLFSAHVSLKKLKCPHTLRNGHEPKIKATKPQDKSQSGGKEILIAGSSSHIQSSSNDPSDPEIIREEEETIPGSEHPSLDLELAESLASTIVDPEDEDCQIVQEYRRLDVQPTEVVSISDPSFPTGGNNYKRSKQNLKTLPTDGDQDSLAPCDNLVTDVPGLGNPEALIKQTPMQIDLPVAIIFPQTPKKGIPRRTGQFLIPQSQSNTQNNSRPALPCSSHSNIRRQLRKHITTRHHSSQGSNEGRVQSFDASRSSASSQGPKSTAPVTMSHEQQVPRDSGFQNNQSEHQVQNPGGSYYFQPPSAPSPYYGPFQNTGPSYHTVQMGYIPVLGQSCCSCPHYCSQPPMSVNIQQLAPPENIFQPYSVQGVQYRQPSPMGHPHMMQPMVIGQRSSQNQSLQIMLPQQWQTSSAMPSRPMTQQFRNTDTFSGGLSTHPYGYGGSPGPNFRAGTPTPSGFYNIQPLASKSSIDMSTKESCLFHAGPVPAVPNLKAATSHFFNSGCRQPEDSNLNPIRESEFSCPGPKSFFEKSQAFPSTEASTKIMKKSPLLSSILFLTNSDCSNKPDDDISITSILRTNPPAPPPEYNSHKEHMLTDSNATLHTSQPSLVDDQANEKNTKNILPFPEKSLATPPGQMGPEQQSISSQLPAEVPFPSTNTLTFLSPQIYKSKALTRPTISLSDLEHSMPISGLGNGTELSYCSSLNLESSFADNKSNSIYGSGISESIEEIEEYITLGGADILEQLTEPGIALGSFSDGVETRLLDNPILAQPFATVSITSDIPPELQGSGTGGTGRSQSLDYFLQDELASEAQTDETSVHKPVCPDILLAWGSELGQGGKPTLNLEVIPGYLLPGGQLFPFRGLGKKPEVDVSISNAPLIGLDHHFVSKLIHYPKAKPSSKKVTSSKALLKELQGNLKKCSVRLECIEVNRTQNLRNTKKPVLETDLINLDLGDPLATLSSNPRPPDLYSRVKLKGKSDRPDKCKRRDKPQDKLRLMENKCSKAKLEKLMIKKNGRKRCADISMHSGSSKKFREISPKKLESRSKNQTADGDLNTVLIKSKDKDLKTYGKLKEPIPNPDSKRKDPTVPADDTSTLTRGEAMNPGTSVKLSTESNAENSKKTVIAIIKRISTQYMDTISGDAGKLKKTRISQDSKLINPKIVGNSNADLTRGKDKNPGASAKLNAVSKSENTTKTVTANIKRISTQNMDKISGDAAKRRKTVPIPDSKPKYTKISDNNKPTLTRGEVMNPGTSVKLNAESKPEASLFKPILKPPKDKNLGDSMNPKKTIANPDTKPKDPTLTGHNKATLTRCEDKNPGTSVKPNAESKSENHPNTLITPILDRIMKQNMDKISRDAANLRKTVPTQDSKPKDTNISDNNKPTLTRAEDKNPGDAAKRKPVVPKPDSKPENTTLNGHKKTLTGNKEDTLKPFQSSKQGGSIPEIWYYDKASDTKSGRPEAQALQIFQEKTKLKMQQAWNLYKLKGSTSSNSSACSKQVVPAQTSGSSGCDGKGLSTCEDLSVSTKGHEDQFKFLTKSDEILRDEIKGPPSTVLLMPSAMPNYNMGGERDDILDLFPDDEDSLNW